MRDSERLELIGKGLLNQQATRAQATSAGKTLLAIAERVSKLDAESSDLESLATDWQGLVVEIVEEQMRAAKRLAAVFGHDDIDVGEPYRKMIARIKRGRC